MPTIQQQINEKFLEKLSQRDDVAPGIIEQLQSLLSGESKLKPDDLAKIFSTPREDAPK
jgi:hypothetical protein